MSQQLEQPKRIRKTYDELEWIHYSSGGYDHYHFEGKPFNGYAVLDYHPNGNVWFEEEFKDGEHYGWDNRYYESGLIEEKVLMMGATPLESVYYDENGQELERTAHVPQEILSKYVEEYKLKE